MIDHTKIKAGDQVQIANGDWFKVNYKKDDELYKVKVNKYSLTYHNLIPNWLITDHLPEFNWDDARSGDAFLNEDGDIFYFIGIDFSDNDYVIICSDKTTDLGHVYPEQKRLLTRHPDADIKKGE